MQTLKVKEVYNKVAVWIESVIIAYFYWDLGVRSLIYL